MNQDMVVTNGHFMASHNQFGTKAAYIADSNPVISVVENYLYARQFGPSLFV